MKSIRPRIHTKVLALAPIAAVLAAGSWSAPAQAQHNVTWDPSRAIVAGTACVKDIDAFVLMAGNDLSVVFSNLGVQLEGAGANTDHKTCAVRVPATVPASVFPNLITQTYEYGYRKTNDASGTLRATVKWFGFQVSPLGLDFPRGPIPADAGLSATRTDPFASGSPWFGGWCRTTRPTNGQLEVNFTVDAERASGRDAVVLFVDGNTLKYDFTARLADCH